VIKGAAKRAICFMGRETAAATASAFRSASCFGTISPMMIDTKVIPATTSARESAPLTGSRRGTRSNARPRDSASRAPLDAPARMPISVMPIWTLDRKRPGSLARSIAALAPRLPLSART
jgi:hypothetical protein